MSIVLEIAELLNDLNPEQRRAVLHQAGPAIVLAGAGSGKTTVLTTRVAYLLQEKQVPATAIFLVTFTNKAATEMQRRVFKYTNQKLTFSGTFHSLAAKILRIEANQGHLRDFGLDSNFTIYDSDDQLSLIKNIYKNNDLDKTQFKPQLIKAKISQAKNELISPTELKNAAADHLQTFTAQIYQAYERRLQAENAIDFDGLLNICYQLLLKNKMLRAKYQNKFTHVLVDEFQDTNKVQYFLTKLLAAPQNNLFAVGDFSQSIYAWRGADYRNLKRLSQDFKDITEYRLERNYRSTQNILDVATSIISNNQSHPVLDLWTDQSSDEKLEIYETSSEELEAEKVASIIHKEYLDRLHEIAILYRTNVQSRTFEEAFLRYQLPYKIVGGTKFYERSEIKDLLAYLRLCFNPLDSPSRSRAEKLGKKRLSNLEKWLSSTKKAVLNQPNSCLQGILESTAYLEKYDQKDPDDLAKLDNIQELFNVASRFDDTLSLLENIALVQDGYLANENQQIEQTETHKITMMSLHSAKGLEFPVVFMVGMEEGLLPHARAVFENQEIEEERRLCYVGITRAKQKLYFSYARNRFTYGHSSNCLPSRFLSEIDSSLVTFNRSFAEIPKHSKNQGTFQQSKNNKQKTNIKLVIDDDSLEALLNDELDIREFLKK